MAIKVGINGFGRIGRDLMRGYFGGDFSNFEIVAVNATGSTADFAHLFKYDSAYGRFDGSVEAYDGGIKINDKEITFVDHRNPEEIPWKELGVELVLDSTGVFTDAESLGKHLKAGAKKAILTANGKGFKNFVMGVNSDTYDPETDHLMGNASCTTNCLAPLTKVVDENFKIEAGLMTTIHAYTNDQNLMDNKHKDLRRARAAALNIIPTTTGAAKAVGEVYPPVQGKMTGYAVRVPVITGSLVDVTYNIEKEATKEEINQAIKKATENEFKGIMAYTEEPIVSSDIIGVPESSIFDASLTIVNGKQIKLVSWYDNEFGYTMRVLDLAEMVAGSM